MKNELIIVGVVALAAFFAGLWVGGMNNDAVGGFTRFPNSDLEAATITSNGAFSATGLSSLSGGAVVGTVSVAANTTLTTASCGEIVVLNDSDGGSTVTLPSATAGCDIAFVVGTAFDTANIVIDSAEGDNIEGLLQVNAADIACSGEDQINVVQTAETVGDRVSLMSDGSSWFILDGAADAAGALTCTDPS